MIVGLILDFSVLMICLIRIFVLVICIICMMNVMCMCLFMFLGCGVDGIFFGVVMVCMVILILVDGNWLIRNVLIYVNVF